MMMTYILLLDWLLPSYQCWFCCFCYEMISDDEGVDGLMVRFLLFTSLSLSLSLILSLFLFLLYRFTFLVALIDRWYEASNKRRYEVRNDWFVIYTRLKNILRQRAYYNHSNSARQDKTTNSIVYSKELVQFVARARESVCVYVYV